MYRNFIILCIFLSNLFISTAQGESNISTQNITMPSYQAKITNINLEEGVIVLDNRTYHIEPKIIVSNHEDLPTDPSSLTSGQTVEFWTNANPSHSHFPAIDQNVNVIKIRILSHINRESIYH